MPNVNRIISPFLGGTGNPDTFTEPTSLVPGSYTPYAAGDLGNAIDWNDRAYQKVIVDSGCTSATPAGLVAANQVAFWKDRTNYVVTNDSRFALFNNVANSYVNNVAGVFRSAVPAGYGCFILIRGRNILVKSGTITAGMLVCAATGSTAADSAGTAISTAAPSEVIGVAIASNSGGNTAVDVDIPNIP